MDITSWLLSPVNAYYLLISLVGFVAMLIDKSKSVKGKWRISERSLMAIAILGGALGIVAAMILCKHKIRKPLFYIGVPVIYLIHRVLVMPFLVRLLIDIDFVW